MIRLVAQQSLPDVRNLEEAPAWEPRQQQRFKLIYDMLYRWKLGLAREHAFVSALL